MILWMFVPTYADAAAKPCISSFVENNTGNGTQLKVTFKAGNTKSYKVWISAKKSASFKKVQYKKSYNGKNQSILIQTYGDSKIRVNKTYYVKIAVFFRKNYKGAKATKTYKVYTAPAATNNISVNKIKTNSAKISWRNISGATKYQVKVNGKSYTQSDLSKSISGLKENKKYTVKVRAYKQVKVNGKKVKLYGVWKSTKFQTKAISNHSDEGIANSKTVINTTTISFGEWKNIAKTDNTYTETRLLSNGCDLDIIYQNENDALVHENAIGYSISTKEGTIIDSFFGSGNNENSTGVVIGYSGLPGQIIIGSYIYTNTATYYDYSQAYRNVSKRLTYSDGSKEIVSSKELYKDVFPNADLYPVTTTETYSDFHMDPYYADLFDQYFDNDHNYSNNKILVDNTNSWILGDSWSDVRTITGPVIFDFTGYIPE